jgi:hypothetical protein
MYIVFRASIMRQIKAQLLPRVVPLAKAAPKVGALGDAEMAHY